MGWYDEDRNASGVLASKLSSDALAVKGQFGDTMGLLTQVGTDRTLVGMPSTCSERIWVCSLALPGSRTCCCATCPGPPEPGYLWRRPGHCFHQRLEGGWLSSGRSSLHKLCPTLVPCTISQWQAVTQGPATCNADFGLNLLNFS